MREQKWVESEGVETMELVGTSYVHGLTITWSVERVNAYREKMEAQMEASVLAFTEVEEKVREDALLNLAASLCMSEKELKECHLDAQYIHHGRLFLAKPEPECEGCDCHLFEENGHH